MHQERCVHCGSCIVGSHLLSEDAEGNILTVAGGILQDEDIPAAESVVGNCPSDALSIIEETRTFDEIKNELMHPEEVLSLDYDVCKFNKDDYRLPILSGRGEYRYNYSSEDKAEREGLKDFRDNIYSQRKALAQ